MLRIETLHALTVVQERSCFIPRDMHGNLPIPTELARLLVLLTEEVARLDKRVKELEERA